MKLNTQYLKFALLLLIVLPIVNLKRRHHRGPFDTITRLINSLDFEKDLDEIEKDEEFFNSFLKGFKKVLFGSYSFENFKDFALKAKKIAVDSSSITSNDSQLCSSFKDGKAEFFKDKYLDAITAANAHYFQDFNLPGLEKKEKSLEEIKQFSARSDSAGYTEDYNKQNDEVDKIKCEKFSNSALGAVLGHMSKILSIFKVPISVTLSDIKEYGLAVNSFISFMWLKEVMMRLYNIYTNQNTGEVILENSGSIAALFIKRAMNSKRNKRRRHFN